MRSFILKLFKQRRLEMRSIPEDFRQDRADILANGLSFCVFQMSTAVYLDGRTVTVSRQTDSDTV